MRKIGLYCGTFNPIHNGHLLIAECAADQFALERVIFVTSPAPPHRKTGLMPAELRHQLVAAAVEDNPRFLASRIELERTGPSYTVDTLLTMKEQFGDATVYLIIGGDNLRSIHDWNRSELLIASCHLLVAPRLFYRSVLLTTDGEKETACLEAVQEDEMVQNYQVPGGTVSVIDFPAVSISSSMVRARLSEGKSILYMVPKPVRDILLNSEYAGKEIHTDG